MGIVAFKWGQNNLTVLQSREVWNPRVRNPAAWDEGGDILAAFSEENGGTWFGCTKTGRVACLVDRMPMPSNGSRRSELLTVEFLKSKKNPQLFIEELAQQRDKWGDLHAFNLIVADVRASGLLFHISKTDIFSEVLDIEPVNHGVHVLSSKGLDKDESSIKTYTTLLDLYRDITLPQMKLLTESLPIIIRDTTTLAVKSSGVGILYERSVNCDWGERGYNFNLNNTDIEY